MPNFPIPGPNSVSWIRCEADEVDEMISETAATFAARDLPFLWVIDPGTKPADLVARLAEHGYGPDPHGEEASVMVLPINSAIEAPRVEGLELHDALADPATFTAADTAAAEAFLSVHLADDPERLAMLERRRVDAVAAGNRRVLLATVDGEPAGSASLALFPPHAAMINGGSVRPKFRGQGVYRALVAARLEMAREAEVAGLVVQAGAMSKPILDRLGFKPVTWRRFYVHRPL